MELEVYNKEILAEKSHEELVGIVLELQKQRELYFNLHDFYQKKANLWDSVELLMNQGITLYKKIES